MAYDIYGENLRPGYCEVHPHIPEEYPCHFCMEHERNKREERAQYNREMREQEQAYYESLVENVGGAGI